jgi:hypothetical protein
MLRGPTAASLFDARPAGARQLCENMIFVEEPRRSSVGRAAACSATRLMPICSVASALCLGSCGKISTR